MVQVLHGRATTTEAVRRAIQHSQESLRVLATKPDRRGNSGRPAMIVHPGHDAGFSVVRVGEVLVLRSAYRFDITSLR